jgi:hypothetical protein
MGVNHRTTSVLGMIFLPLLLFFGSVYSQELDPDDVDATTDDVRCVEDHYRHKTVAELELMTAQQLIDESERHWNYHVGLMDQYGLFTLHSYTDKIGTAIIPVLKDLATKFRERPRSKCNEQRFFTALAIASDVDDQIVRLGTTKEGVAAILMADGALEQMKNSGLADPPLDPQTKYPRPYSKYPFGLLLLSKMRGINDHDVLMRELLSSEFNVKLSDGEFVRLVDFVTSTTPTYPGWTPRINMARDLRKNKEKYYAAYVRFQKTVLPGRPN